MSSLSHPRRTRRQLSPADRPRPGVSLLLSSLPHLLPGRERHQSAGFGANLRRAAAAIGQQARADGSYLVPLRLFIGLGWLRTCVEKAIDPAWHNGSALSDFLQGQLVQGAVPFPFYEALSRALFLPHATGLSWMIVIGEFLAGMAIFTGCCTRAALLGGLFMNLNFLLAGVPKPSAFYIVIQVTLLLANTGAILGVDGIRNARPVRSSWNGRWRYWATALLALVTAAYAGSHATDTSPAGSVRDPAMILAVLATMILLWALLALLRQGLSHSS